MPAHLALSCWLGRVLQGPSQGRAGCQAAISLLKEASCSTRAGRCKLGHRCCCCSMSKGGLRVLQQGLSKDLLLSNTTSVPEDSRHCLMLLASPLTCGLLQWVQSCLTGQADTCCSRAATGKLLWWPVAEHSLPTCSRKACAG